ncbi:metallophosphoesterase [Pediococcus pentosaceus]|uniref:metallophosphoesterase n=1 Tax=Pediococcus pentosaceus TaxID=1255 RepID=UPI001F57F5DC|nr:metallophosphoesterase [Pediococcus pentosaceus]MCI2960351.1 metallophosphoesterase [Pediococcus pentosaceus]
MAELITLDTYKQMIKAGEAFNIAKSFNARVGDEQVPLVVKFLERGKAQQFEDGLVPFMSGFVGNLDDAGKVTAETGEPVSYTGTRSDIVGLGMVKMNLPGMMFPQEGYFYGFLGLETPDHSKRVSTFSVWFHVYNGNPDMFVNKEPFRSELQKELDRVEVLIEQTEGTIKAKLIEWEKLINDLITNKNIDLEQLESRMATAEGNLKLLEDKIKADGLATQADLDAFIKQISNMLFDVVNVDEGADIGEALPNNLKKQLDDFKAKLPEDQFKIAIISDAHYEDRYRNTIWGSYPHTKDAYKHLTAFNYLQDAVDVMIANGDHVNGLDASVENTKQELSAYNEKMLTGVNTDRYALAGNHDDGSPSKSYNKAIAPAEIISNDELEQLFHTHDLINGEVRNDGSMYFYKDYDEAKIRLVGLYTEDIPENAVNDDGTPKFTRWLYHTYGQAQLDWLAKVAFSNIPKEYQVVVVGHTPLYYGWTDTGANQYNFELVKGLLDAVDVGNSYSGSSSSAVPTDMQVSVNADYSEQGPRPVAAFIAGHVHKELTVPLDRFTMTTVLNDANTDSTVESDSAQSMAFTVYCFDTAKRKVSMYGFGRATDRKYDY